LDVFAALLYWGHRLVFVLPVGANVLTLDDRHLKPDDGEAQGPSVSDCVTIGTDERKPMEENLKFSQSKQRVRERYFCSFMGNQEVCGSHASTDISVFSAGKQPL
jgi:hypothetical protein